MKQVILLGIISTLLIPAAHAQNIIKEPSEANTLFNSGESIGGFIGFRTKVGDVNDESGLFVGGEIAAVFSHRMNIGFAGYGLVTEIDADTRGQDGELFQLNMGYGGLFLEPVIGSNKIVHLTLPIIIGAGGVGLTHERFISTNHNHEFIEDTDAFFIIEPGLNMQINLLKYVRLDVGLTYRHIDGTNIEEVTDDELGGLTVGMGLRFGWF